MSTPTQDWRDVPRSLAFYAVFYLGSAVMLLGSWLPVRLDRTRLPAFVARWARFHRWCARALAGIDVAVAGEAPNRPVLVAMKHESFFEAIDIPCLFEWPVTFVKAELTRLPIWGEYSDLYGNIAVEREAGAKALRAMLGAARAQIAVGRPLVIFPEGTRVPPGTIAPLQSGFAGLYTLLGLPVVPVAVASGAFYHRRWKRRGTVVIRFGAELPPGLARAEIEARVTAAINALNQ